MDWKHTCCANTLWEKLQREPWSHAHKAATPDHISIYIPYSIQPTKVAINGKHMEQLKQDDHLDLIGRPRKFFDYTNACMQLKCASCLFLIINWVKQAAISCIHIIYSDLDFCISNVY